MGKIKKSKILKKPVRHLNLTGVQTLFDLVQAFQHTSFQSRNVYRCFEVFRKMLGDPECIVFLGLSGAMIPGGMRQVISDMNRMKLVDVIVSTGANMFHDLFENFGYRHYVGSDEGDDDALRRHWRLLRDWFYDSNMHGNDWQKMREKYDQLVPFVSHRMDLDYIFGELVGELNSGHTYVDWGDFERVKRIEGGLLGCDLEADPSGFYKIKKIYKGENWHSDFRSPLTEYGVNIKEGDFIIAIDGHELSGKVNPYKHLESKADKVVTLLVNSKPSKDGAREEKVRTVKSEQNLFYLDWVNSRMKMVDELSGGKIGYIHIPNTATEGNRELYK